VRAADADQLPPASQVAERFGALHDREPQVTRPAQLRMVGANRGGDDESPRGLDVSRVVAGDDLDAEPGEVFGARCGEVAAGDVDAAADE
jgi:hypothetical protein